MVPSPKAFIPFPIGYYSFPKRRVCHFELQEGFQFFFHLIFQSQRMQFWIGKPMGGYNPVARLGRVPWKMRTQKWSLPGRCTLLTTITAWWLKKYVCQILFIPNPKLDEKIKTFLNKKQKTQPSDHLFFWWGFPKKTHRKLYLLDRSSGSWWHFSMGYWIEQSPFFNGRRKFRNPNIRLCWELLPSVNRRLFRNKEMW